MWSKHSKQTGNIPPLKINDEIHTWNHAKADILNETLVAINIKTRNMSNQVQIPHEDLTNPYEVMRIIKSMRPFKAPGEDGIIPKILKKVSKKTVTQLHYIYNACLRLQYFPTNGKMPK